MKLYKKLFLGLLALLAATAGVLYYMHGKDNYDASKYHASITPAPRAPVTEEANAETGAVPSTVPASQGLQPGMTVELTLPDQFDESHSIGSDITTLVFAFSKTSGGLVRGFFDAQDVDFLKAHKAMFIADISSLPVVIRNSLALPKLRKSPYSVLLIYEEEMSKALKNEEHADDANVVTVEGNVVKDIKYVSTAEDLAEVFK